MSETPVALSKEDADKVISMVGEYGVRPILNTIVHACTVNTDIKDEFGDTMSAGDVLQMIWNLNQGMY